MSEINDSLKEIIKIRDVIGFSTLPEQLHRKQLKRGFDFTILVTGESGLGKSTLINSLFLTDLYKSRHVNLSADKTTEIKVQTIELEERGVKLRLTIVDTPGFGEGINSNECFKPIIKYIDDQYEKYYLNEMTCGSERKRIHDPRVDCCLYFIPSWSRGLRPIDIECLRQLKDRVNIIPVIGKADSLTKTELECLKRKILDDLDRFDVKIYEFPATESDDDEEFKRLDEEIKSCVPFAVIGSNTIVEFNGKRIRSRVYPWGIVDIELNCDFTQLRTFLCSSHMQDLKDVTDDLYYENFRSKYMHTRLHQINAYQNVNESNDRINELSDKLLQEKEIEIEQMHKLIDTMKSKLSLHNSPATTPRQVSTIIQSNASDKKALTFF